MSSLKRPAPGGVPANRRKEGSDRFADGQQSVLSVPLPRVRQPGGHEPSGRGSFHFRQSFLTSEEDVFIVQSFSPGGGAVRVDQSPLQTEQAEDGTSIYGNRAGMAALRADSRCRSLRGRAETDGRREGRCAEGGPAAVAVGRLPEGGDALRGADPGRPAEERTWSVRRRDPLAARVSMRNLQKGRKMRSECLGRHGKLQNDPSSPPASERERDVILR